MTTTEVASLKRTELQAAACRLFGKSAAGWTGRATNEELRQALTEGEPPARLANGNGLEFPGFSGQTLASGFPRRRDAEVQAPSPWESPLGLRIHQSASRSVQRADDVPCP